jgi:hypothetical protein
MLLLNLECYGMMIKNMITNLADIVICFFNRERMSSKKNSYDMLEYDFRANMSIVKLLFVKLM